MGLLQSKKVTSWIRVPLPKKKKKEKQSLLIWMTVTVKRLIENVFT